MLFSPTTERERIHAAVLDWDNARHYLDGAKFDDPECAMAASALLSAKSTRSKASEAHAVILRRWPMFDAAGKQTAAALVRDGGKWWIDLIIEGAASGW
jgi:hypothetical protein